MCVLIDMPCFYSNSLALKKPLISFLKLYRALRATSCLARLKFPYGLRIRPKYSHDLISTLFAPYLNEWLFKDLSSY